MRPSSSAADEQVLPSSEPQFRNPRRRQSSFGLNTPASLPVHVQARKPQSAIRNTGASSRKSKMSAYQNLSGHSQEREDGGLDSVDSASTSKSGRRFVSMPQPLASAPLVDVEDLHSQHHHYRHHYHHDQHHRLASYLASPPIVDFTRFEDTYRGPRDQSFEGLVTGRRSSRTSDGRRGGMRSGSTGVNVASKADNMSRLHRKGMTRTRTSGKSVSPPAPSPPQLASERKPDPRVLLGAVNGILQATAGAPNNPDSNLDWKDYLDKDELLAMHQLDQLDFEERENVGERLEKTGRLEVVGLKVGALTILGEPVRKAFIYASTTMILGKEEHHLPILVVQCVEELYRTGIYQPNLFRTLPNRARLLELINIFDSAEQIPGSFIRSRRESPRSGSSAGGSRKSSSIKKHSKDHQAPHYPPVNDQSEASNLGFGSNTSLHLESTSDICALLVTYLSSLPEPVMDQKVFEAIWDLCGVAEEDEDEDSDESDDDSDDGGRGGGGYAMHRKPDSSFRRRHHPTTPSTPRIPVPLARTYTTPSENTQIALAQLLLHLLPSPNFSLILYLLAFFSQVALVREENGLGVEDLARMFGGRIFGGEKIPMGGRNKSRTFACPSPPPSYTSSPPKSRSIREVEEDDEAVEKPFNTTQTRRQGEIMMAWFLRRWGPISEALYDIVEDAKMGVFGPICSAEQEVQKKQRPVGAALRKDSFGDVLTMRNEDSEDEEPRVSEDYRGREERRRGSGSSGSHGRKTPTQSQPDTQQLRIQRQPRAQTRTTRRQSQPNLPTIRVDAPQRHSTPKKTHVHPRAVSRGGADVRDDLFDDGYVVLAKDRATSSSPHDKKERAAYLHDTGARRCSATTDTDESFYSLPSVDERLMDVSMPRCLMNDTTTMNNLTSSDSREEEGMRNILPPVTGSVIRDHSSLPQPQSSRRSPHPNNHANDSDLQKRITLLENDLRERTAALSDALADLATSRKEYAFLATKMSELEMENDSPPAKAPVQRQERHVPAYVGHFVEHLDDSEEEESELQRSYAAVYEAMGPKPGFVDGISSRKPAPRN